MELATELDAARLLKAVSTGDFAGDIDPQELTFGDWSSFNIHLPGESYVLPTTVMRGVLALQESLYRGSAVILDGQPNITYLSTREKELLTLRALISEGSTDLKIDFNEIIGNLVGPLVGKLSANQIVTLVLSGVLVWGGSSFYRTYASDKLSMAELEIEDAQHQRLMEHLSEHSEQDLEIKKALNLAMKNSVRASQVYSVQRKAAPEIIKGLKNANASSLEGIPLSPAVVDTIVGNARTETVEKIINGRFRIENVNTKSSEGFRIRLENVVTGDTFTAGLEDAFVSIKTRAVIETATYKKTPVEATIIAKLRQGKIVEATISSADHPRE